MWSWLRDVGNGAIDVLDPLNITGFQGSFSPSEPTESPHPPLPSAVDLQHPPPGMATHVPSNPGGYAPAPAQSNPGFMASMGGWGYVPGKGPQWGSAGNYSSPGGFGQGNRI